MKFEQTQLYKIIGNKLKTRRIELKKTQEELAEKLHVSRTSITNIESGIQKAPLHTIYEICDILDVEVQMLFPAIEDLKQERNLKVHGKMTNKLSLMINELISEETTNEK